MIQAAHIHHLHGLVVGDHRAGILYTHTGDVGGVGSDRSVAPEGDETRGRATDIIDLQAAVHIRYVERVSQGCESGVTAYLVMRWLAVDN
jgi:hypothetical protein